MRFPKLRLAWSVCWGMACVLLIFLWIRSYRRIEGVHAAIAGRTLDLSSLHGRVMFAVTPQRQANATNRFLSGGRTPAWGVISYPYERPIPDITNRNLGLPEFPGFDLYSLGDGTIRAVVPHCFVLLLWLVLFAASWVHWSKQFSLRTLLITTTLIAIALGAVAYAIK